VATSVRPIPNVPALRLADPNGGAAAVVIADLHLGLGATAERPRGPPEASADRLAAELTSVCRRERAGRLIVAGDVKHPIVGAPPWLRPVLFDFFATLLAADIATDVVLGNHDVGLARFLPREVEVRPATGLVVGSVGIFHGHRWPSDEVLASPTIVAGHLHPGYRFAPSAAFPDGKRRSWVRVEFPPSPKPKRRRRHVLRSRELVVLPAFHPLAGAESLNRERPRRGRSFLYQRFLARGTARVYLLDGSDLGVLPNRPAGREPAAPAARRRN
jgi:metallophosphoesterase superfamily enzyme